ncbi:protein phosphatase 1 regulatory subunit 36 isoform 3-T6 [Amazona ochrocephala]
MVHPGVEQCKPITPVCDAGHPAIPHPWFAGEWEEPEKGKAQKHCCNSVPCERPGKELRTREVSGGNPPGSWNAETCLGWLRPASWLVRPGVWYWKDDTNTLQFASSSPAAEKNLKEGKNTLFQEICVRTLKSIFQDDCSSKLPERKLVDKEGKLHMISQWVQHEYVTLDDVKYAALLLKDTHESHHMLSLEVVMGNKKLDDFLMALLFYISFYLEKIALEKRYRSLTLTMISFEKTEMDNVLEKLAMSRIHLARLYCNLMLGRHMAQQSSRKEKPSLQRDRSYSEGLYNFSSYVTWLVFRRKHFQVIREEIGRLLFSDVFNPALRGKKNTVLQKQGGGAGDANTVQLLYPRKDRVKHPSISTMIQQCSPVVRTLLPLLKDSAQYLFQNQDCQARDLQPRTCDDLPDFSELFTNK